MNVLDYVKAELVWKELVVKGEIETLKKMSQKAHDLAKEKQDEFLSRRPHAKNYSKKLYDKEYLKQRSEIAYRGTEESGWVYKTLLEEKRTSLFKTCNNLVLVGSGMYPYSLFDIHKRFKHIKLFGVEIDKNRAKISESLIVNSKAKDSIKVICADGNDLNYEWMTDEDLIFISCDVDSKEMIPKIMQKSKAHIFICAPYDKTWLKNLIYEMKYIYSTTGIVNLTDS